MIKHFILVTLVTALSLIPLASAQVPDEKIEAMYGTWIHRDLHYVFEDTGKMKIIKVKGEPKGYKTFEYSWQRIENYDFIYYGESLSENGNLNFLLIDDVSDSSAVLSVGTSFVRADSSKGFPGTWKHIKDFTTILLNIEFRTITYNETIFDVETGNTIKSEERTGQFDMGKGRNSGQIYIRFQDVTEVKVVPVLLEDIMYLFDLNPGKSFFRKVERAPAYSEYKKALNF
ncbi:hypothetical protein ACFL1R_02760 [Candidatus Latescibacterota bacterium]